MTKLFVILGMFFAISVNAQWEPDVRMTNAMGFSFTKSNWCIAANENVVHVVWHDNREGKFQIYYKRSTDDGVTWGSDTKLTNGTVSSENPSIAVNGSNVHIVWSYPHISMEIYYKRSTNAGETWGVDTRLTNKIYSSANPSIAVSGTNLHVIWQDNRNNNWEIYYKRSTDGGTNWGADIRLTNNTAISEWPSIAVSGSLVHILWRDYRDGNDEIYYKRSTDSGVTWEADTRLTNNFANSYSPSIAVSGSLVHTIWRDYRDGNDEIYYKRSTDSGASWGADTRLTNNFANSYSPSIAVSGSLVHTVWEDSRNNNWEIYYKRSTDGGINWEADTRLTINTASSNFSSVAVSDSLVHVVWEDYRDNNYEIYYKRNPTGNTTTGIQNISTETPSEYSLSQNYPNPFNPVTKIRFEVTNGFPVKTSGNDKAGGISVKLVVYDVTGREVQTLVNERLQPGTYEATFDGSALNSGVYFYKLMTNGFTETKKMLLIK